MNDLEMTRLCAEAMGYLPALADDAIPIPFMVMVRSHPMLPEEIVRYDPLHDDAQAMALVKKLFLSCAVWDWEDGEPREWLVTCKGNMPTMTKSADLNRAIVECVAKMTCKS